MTKKAMGRPTFKKTPALSRKVQILKGGGMSDDSIAFALGISRPTLLKHFGIELNEGWAKCRAEVTAAMFRTAKKGNVAAQKAYLGLGDPIPERQAPKQEKLGKKEVAQIEAEKAPEGDGWSNLLQ